MKEKKKKYDNVDWLKGMIYLKFGDIILRYKKLKQFNFYSANSRKGTSTKKVLCAEDWTLRFTDLYIMLYSDLLILNTLLPYMSNFLNCNRSSTLFWYNSFMEFRCRNRDQVGYVSLSLLGRGICNVWPHFRAMEVLHFKPFRPVLLWKHGYKVRPYISDTCF